MAKYVRRKKPVKYKFIFTETEVSALKVLLGNLSIDTLVAKYELSESEAESLQEVWLVLNQAD